MWFLPYLLTVLAAAIALPAQPSSPYLEPAGQAFPPQVWAGSPLPGPSTSLAAAMTAPPVVIVGTPVPSWHALRALARWELAWGPPPVWAFFYVAVAPQPAPASWTAWGDWFLGPSFWVVVRWDILDGDWTWPLPPGAVGVPCWLQWPAQPMGTQTWQLQGFLVTASGSRLTQSVSVTTLGAW